MAGNFLSCLAFGVWTNGIRIRGKEDISVEAGRDLGFISNPYFIITHL